MIRSLALLLLTLFSMSGCKKVDVSGRGEDIFDDITALNIDESIQYNPVSMAEDFSLYSWEDMEYLPELNNFNHFLAGYDIKDVIPLRRSKPCSKARGRCNTINDINYEKNYIFSYNENKKISIDRPIFFNDQILVSDSYGVISLFDTGDDFATLWEFSLPKQLGKTIIGSTKLFACYENGIIVFSTDNGNAFALSEKTGQLLWNKELKEPIRSAIRCANGVTYIKSEIGNIIALSTSSGKTLVTESSDSNALSYITLDASSVSFDSKGDIFTGNSNGMVEGYRASMFGRESLFLSLIWRDTVHSSSNQAKFKDIDSTPKIIDGDKVLVGSVSSGMLMFNASTLEVEWRNDLSVISDIVTMDGYSYFIDNLNHLICMENKSGKVKWFRKLISEAYFVTAKYLNNGMRKNYVNIKHQGPIIINGFVFVLNSDGTMTAFDAFNGFEITSLDIPYKSSKPIIINGNMYLVSYSSESLIVIGKKDEI